MTTDAKPATARLTIIWVVLMAATILSWLLGHETGGDHQLASAGVIAIAFLKVRFVGQEFMELRHAPRVMSWAFDAWLLVTGGVLIAMVMMRASLS